MPGEDGYALIDKIRRLGLERGGATPALALTGYAGSEEGERVLAAGFQAHVAKPIGANELIQVIATIAVRNGAGKVA
jgi:CheY-like chemotaxis protein